MQKIPPGRLPTEVRDCLGQELKAEYDSGKSIRDLAEATGRSYSWVHDLLVKAETGIRPGSPVPHMAREERATLGQKLRAAYESDPTASIATIAESIGRTPGWTRYLLEQAGTAMRPIGHHTPHKRQSPPTKETE